MKSKISLKIKKSKVGKMFPIKSWLFWPMVIFKRLCSVGAPGIVVFCRKLLNLTWLPRGCCLPQSPKCVEGDTSGITPSVFSIWKPAGRIRFVQSETTHQVVLPLSPLSPRNKVLILWRHLWPIFIEFKTSTAEFLLCTSICQPFFFASVGEFYQKLLRQNIL